MRIHVNKNFYKKYTETHTYGDNQVKAKAKRFKQLAKLSPYHTTTTKNKHTSSTKHNKTIGTPAFVSEFLQCAQLHLSAEKAFLGIYNIELKRLSKKDQKFIKLLYTISQANFEAAIQEHALKDSSNANSAKLLSTIRGMLLEHTNQNNNNQNNSNNQAPQLHISLTDKAAKTKPTKADPIVVDKDKKTVPKRQPLKLANSTHK